ncbi:helix-turn-helix domain-containing protein [Gardnerella sp. DNF00476]|uniref:helix-turn-helix domain-containing protein n=1 Tax=Gardnerella sp. DNF00476 TaxID=2749047 RepID=UPI003BAF54B0
MPTSSQLGLALKNVLTKANITQDTLATKAGIPRNTLNRKINGGVFRFDELTRISKVCKMPLSKILEQAEKQAAIASKEKSQSCLPG